MASTISADASLLNRQAWSMRFSRRGQATSLARRALALSNGRRGQDAHARGLAYRTLAWSARWSCDLQRSLDLSDLAQKHLEDCGQSVADDVMSLQVLRGTVYLLRGERLKALDCQDHVTSQTTPHSRRETRVDVLLFCCAMFHANQDHKRAQSVIDQARQIAVGGEIALLEYRATRRMFLTKGPAASIGTALQALASARKQANRVILPYTLELAARAHIDAGHLQSAERALSEGLHVARTEGDPRAECHLLHLAARMHRSAGDHIRARELLETGLVTARSLRYLLWHKNFLRELAGLYEFLGDDRKALVMLKEFMHLTERDSL